MNKSHSSNPNTLKDPDNGGNNEKLAKADILGHLSQSSSQ